MSLSGRFGAPVSRIDELRQGARRSSPRASCELASHPGRATWAQHRQALISSKVLYFETTASVSPAVASEAWVEGFRPQATRRAHGATWAPTLPSLVAHISTGGLVRDGQAAWIVQRRARKRHQYGMILPKVRKGVGHRGPLLGVSRAGPGDS